MSCSVYEEAAGFEHRFWLQILGDHSRFIFGALSPAEKGEIRKAADFIKILDDLLCQARQPLAGEQMAELTACAFEWAKGLRCFKLELLNRQLCDNLNEYDPDFYQPYGQ